MLLAYLKQSVDAEANWPTCGKLFTGQAKPSASMKAPKIATARVNVVQLHRRKACLVRAEAASVERFTGFRWGMPGRIRPPCVSLRLRCLRGEKCHNTHKLPDVSSLAAKGLLTKSLRRLCVF